jgi:septum formation protein
MLGLPHKILPANIDETVEDGLSPEDFAKKMAVAKVEKVLYDLSGKIPQWVFGADTLIALDDIVLNKSKSREEARQSLKKLSGRSHKVITACALFCGKTKNIDCRIATTIVHFAELDSEILEWYLNTGEWQGAAGSYQIQGLAGCFINRIEGSFSGVVGLPLRLFYLMLLENGYDYGNYVI